MAELPIFYSHLTSPIGELLLASSAAGLLAIRFEEEAKALPPSAEWRCEAEPFHEAIQQLREYFAGKRLVFDLPLAPQGTPFQLKVWQALQEIPYGETISYSELANRIGNPRAVRAVGAANGSNPIPIIIPCHRVIGSNGALVGYGGGLPIKKKLLALEKEHYAKTQAQRSLF